MKYMIPQGFDLMLEEKQRLILEQERRGTSR